MKTLLSPKQEGSDYTIPVSPQLVSFGRAYNRSSFGALQPHVGQ
jgi:hypothetical protein